MSDQQSSPGAGPIIATGLVANTIGGAVAGLVIGYIHFRYNFDFNNPDNAAYAGYIQTICETAISGSAMIGHVIYRRFAN